MSGFELRSAFALAIVVAVLAAGCGNNSDDATAPRPESAIRADPGDLSQVELEKIAADLEQYAADNGVTNPPEVEIVRVVSLADWPQTYAQCLTQAGFPSTSSGDGGVSTDIPAGQDEAADLASYECHAKYPVDPSQNGRNLTDLQKEQVYEYLTATLVDCLEERGYQVNQIPSRDVFMSGFDESPPWNPYTEIFAGNVGAGEGDELQSECPPNTPPELLYGD